MNSSDWNDDRLQAWREAQQRYWVGLAELSRFKSSASDPLHSPAWKQGLEQWWGKVAPEAPPQTQDILKRVLDMGKVYLGLAEQVYGSTSDSMPAEGAQPNLESWMQSLETGFADWQKQLTQGRSASSGFGLGSNLFDGWQQVISSMHGMDAFRNVGVGGVHMLNVDLWQDYLQKALQTPAWGLGDESRADLQQLSERALVYQQAMDAYLEAYAGQGQTAVRALRSRLQQLADAGDTVGSLRELYDLWVDVSEAVYADFAMSERYQSVYGEMVNAFFGLKQAANAWLDRRLCAAGLPTRADLRLAWGKQQALRRENQVLQRQVRAVEQRLVRMELRLTAGEGHHDSV